MTLPGPSARTALRTAVLDWYEGHARDLPWRHPETSAWGVLVSEVMLQQTPVARVEPRWREWIARWPTPADLAAAPTAEVLRAWDRLGYPRRALRLRAAARSIVTEHAGVVPEDEQTLRTLPGIGHYTAAAVAAFAYGRRAVVLDTNVRRVLARAVRGEALPPPSQRRSEGELAESLLPDDGATAARFSVAVMELGALVCTARSPGCQECPLLRRCAWLAAGRPEDAHAGRRRTQAWHGTDRQARGRVMAALREQDQLGTAELADLWPEAGQRERILAALVADGLAAVQTDADGVPLAYRLPVDEPH